MINPDASGASHENSPSVGPSPEVTTTTTSSQDSEVESGPSDHHDDECGRHRRFYGNYDTLMACIDELMVEVRLGHKSF